MQETKIQRHRWLTVAPVVLLLVIGALAASGLSLLPMAGAVNTDDVNVSATVAAELHVSACANQGPEPLTVGLDDTAIGALCTVTFGTTQNAAGANLLVANGNANQFLCVLVAAVRNCGTANFPDEATTGDTSLADGEAGFVLDGVGSTASEDITADNSYGLPATGSPTLICHTLDTTDKDCALTFKADTTATQAPGTYEGIARFTMAAR